MNRRVIFIGMIVLCALIAAQCNPPAAPATPTVAPPVKVTYLSFSDGSGLTDPVDQSLLDRFEAAHPGIEIVPSVSDAFNSPLEGHLAASPPPDIVAIAADYVALSTIGQGSILDLGDMWKRLDLGKTYPANFQAWRERDGKQYFLPIGYTWAAIYYNKRIFNRYNLKPPKTWDEFLGVCDMLQASGIPPIALGWSFNFSGATWWFDYLDLRLNGPQFHADLVRGQVRYDDPRTRKAFETWKDLLDGGYFTEGADTRSFLQSLALVYDGKAAMILSDSSEVGALPKEFQDELDFFPFPIMDSGVPVGEVTRAFGYAIPAKAPHAAQAMNFLDYLVSVDVQTTLARQAGQNRGMLPIDRGVEAAALAPQARQGLALVTSANHIGLQYIASFGTVGAPDGSGLLGYSAYYAFNRFLKDTNNLDSSLDALEAARQKAFGY
jgi:ABC-type glycerol-3-phosphate transport system substrate-binding protein